jgi:hypothetical protein
MPITRASSEWASEIADMRATGSRPYGMWPGAGIVFEKNGLWVYV